VIVQRGQHSHLLVREIAFGNLRTGSRSARNDDEAIGKSKTDGFATTDARRAPPSSSVVLNLEKVSYVERLISI
jgi:hypothetical protein